MAVKKNNFTLEGAVQFQESRYRMSSHCFYCGRFIYSHSKLIVFQPYMENFGSLSPIFQSELAVQKINVLLHEIVLLLSAWSMGIRSINNKLQQRVSRHVLFCVGGFILISNIVLSVQKIVYIFQFMSHDPNISLMFFFIHLGFRTAKMPKWNLMAIC